MKHDTEADVRGDTAIKIGALFFIALIVLAFTTDPIATGTREGDRAPPLEGMMYNGSGWSAFDLNDYLTPNWVDNDSSASWVVVEFMDTDCPYCVDAAEEMGQFSNYFMKYQGEDGTPPSDNNPPAWRGPLVNFIASATQLDITGHDTSRDEIEGFRDKTGGESCASRSCSERPGTIHQFPYIDDIDQENMDAWKVGGTPEYFILQPDGIVAWVASEHDETLSDALFRLTEELVE
ncbi:hypothetical protein N8392_00200 [Candidatus Poseidonia sp.]|nr:hypothetical protein [Poseidonia sp.]